MTANDIKFRCSSLGYLMSDALGKSNMELWLKARDNYRIARKKWLSNTKPDSKSAKNDEEKYKKYFDECRSLDKIKYDVKLGDVCKTHLVDTWISAKHGRREEKSNKFLEKGNECEESSITLLSRVNKKFYKKNEIRLENDFITGLPDIYTGETIYNADEITDTKSSWSAHTFFRAVHSKLNSDYDWQLQGYMWLTGAKKAWLAYCLVNGTYSEIMNEKERLKWQIKSIDFENDPEYIRKCKQIELNHIFDLKDFQKHNPGFDFHNDVSNWNYDIPFNERVHLIEIKRDDSKIKAIEKRVVDARKWMSINLKWD